MEHASPVIATIVISLVFAYAGGLAARLIGLPNIVGYLVAGIIVGPYTPGFIADPKLTTELAEIGVALLMFTIGLHFSLRDLTVVWHIAVPGALVQIAGCTALGYGIGLLLGWPPGAALILGLAIAISSTAVATKALEERRQLATEAGRITLGWLVVQDVVVIVALVLLPLVAREAPDLRTLALLTGETMLMIALFLSLLLGVGRWLLPAILGWTARFGSQELFTLGVIVIALGIAYGSASLLGLSVALGAFFAGMVLGESDLSYQAAAESLPIQSIFTVLFFVSVGTLFNPMLFITAPLQIISLVIAILAGCGIIFFFLLILLGVRGSVAGLVAGTLAQVGEFSFILTTLAAGLGLMTGTQQGLVLAAALSSILLHSLTIRAYGSLAAKLDGRFDLPLGPMRLRNPHSNARALAVLRDHVIIVGHGRVGSVIARALKTAGQTFVVIDGQWRVSEFARTAGTTVIFGDATREEVFKVARPRHARLIVVALPDAFRTRRVIELARQANPQIGIVARAHSDEDYQYLTELRVGLVIMGEREIALSMSDYTLRQMGLDAASAQDVVDRLRKGILAKSKNASAA
ncbi:MULTISPECIES: cation:proton antiporter [Rhodomicrobium]|uniref:cation:proton antiporter n=1 Tax=Rhodomicrobium TaxID=1068 RepID=UPI000B4BE97E|nr:MULTISPECIES: cation:proton antiporter [Rhodomicrobium]